MLPSALMSPNSFSVSPVEPLVYVDAGAPGAYAEGETSGGTTPAENAPSTCTGTLLLCALTLPVAETAATVRLPPEMAVILSVSWFAPVSTASRSPSNMRAALAGSTAIVVVQPLTAHA